MTKTKITAGIITCILIFGCTSAPAPSTGEKIVSDPSLFSEAFVKDFAEKRMNEETYTMRVPDEAQPEIAQVIEKYGEPDKIEDADWTVTFTPDWEPIHTRMITHQYGRFILAVEKENPEQTVVYMKMMKQ